MPITRRDISSMISEMMLWLSEATDEQRVRRIKKDIAIFRAALKKGESSEEWGHAEHMFAMWSEG